MNFAGRYILETKIGEGAFAEVWKARDQKLEGQVVALKIMAPNQGFNSQISKMFMDEYKQVFLLNHPGLLKPIHYDTYNNSPFLVMPYCAQGSLAELIERKGSLSEEKIAHIIYRVASALNYLHRNLVLHNDLKPDNILILSENEYALCDFGISAQTMTVAWQHTQNKPKEDKGIIATDYAAPEIFSTQPKPGRASDIFSLGVTIFELCTGNTPWPKLGGLAAKNNQTPPEIYGEYSGRLQQLISLCLAKEPSKRPNAEMLEKWAKFYIDEGYWNFDSTSSIKKSNPKKEITDKQSRPNKVLIFSIIFAILLVLSLVFLIEGKKNNITDFRDSEKIEVKNIESENLQQEDEIVEQDEEKFSQKVEINTSEPSINKLKNEKILTTKNNNDEFLEDEIVNRNKEKTVGLNKIKKNNKYNITKPQSLVQDCLKAFKQISISDCLGDTYALDNNEKNKVKKIKEIRDTAQLEISKIADCDFISYKFNKFIVPLNDDVSDELKFILNDLNDQVERLNNIKNTHSVECL